MPKGGARPGAGNPGYGKLQFIKNKVDKHSKLWWETWADFMNGDDKSDKKFAMIEFNKLQTKMIPQQLSGDDDGGPLKIQIIRANGDKTDPTT